MVPEPRGVVVALTPWNDPIAVAAGLIGAALATGNAVVHKPSERCPQTGRRFAELMAAHLPEGVLEVVSGDGAVGAALVAGDVDVVAHVGSSSAGRAIALACARSGAKALLENGGNDALIVDEDVDAEWAAAQAALGAFANAGQICVSVERIYCHCGGRRSLRRCVGRRGEGVARSSRAARRSTSARTRTRPRDRGHRRRRARWRAAKYPVAPERSTRPRFFSAVSRTCRSCRRRRSGRLPRCAWSRTSRLRFPRRRTTATGLRRRSCTSDMAHAQAAWRALPVGTVKVNEVFGERRAEQLNRGAAAAPGSVTVPSCSTR